MLDGNRFHKHTALGNHFVLVDELEGIALADHDEAQSCYGQALSLVPDFPPALHGMGQRLEHSEQYDQAISFYDVAIQGNAYLADAWHGKARCLAQLGRFGDAVASYEREYEAQLLTSIGPG